MQKKCLNCENDFTITQSDLDFYKKVSPKFAGKTYKIPSPTLCPDCRQQRRLAFRNERNLYLRECTHCQKKIVSMYSKEAPFPIFCNECWWGDNWDPLEYGVKFNFNRNFFDQFYDLMQKVPRAGVIVYKCENCDYNSLIGICKNAYLSHGSYNSEDLLYARKNQYCRNCTDTMFLDNCELIYEGINSKNCYNCKYIQNCKNCHDSEYLVDCDSCENCFMCAGLKHKKYCIKNKQYTKEIYENKIKEFKQKTSQILQKEFEEFSKTVAKKYQHQFNCENSNGDYLQNCKNAEYCYDAYLLEDCKYVIEAAENKDMMDVDFLDKNNELCYESLTGGDSNQRVLFSDTIALSNQVLYSQSIMNGQNCFGCISLPKKTKYCILNKHYSKEEYEEILPKIIAHIQKTGEWGEFFPIEISPFAYNETLAQEYFPLNKEGVLNKGWKWKEVEDKIPDVRKIIPAERLPDNIKDIPDDILNWAIKCKKTGRPFKIQKVELEFYRKMNLSVPHFHPDVRHAMRMKKRNPRKLWQRECAKCQIEIETTYALNQPEKILCEKCYQKEIN